MKLNELRENPNNPSKAGERELERLAGKLKRVPLGLTAMRIAYVTDTPEGGKMVISGNKRLRVLKRAYGEDAELPDEWFQDVTAMSEAERHEFIVSANVTDGEWDLDRLLEQYDLKELNEWMDTDPLEEMLKNKERTKELTRDSDAVPEVDGEWRSEMGKVYQLGRHRLLCYDSTKEDVVQRLLGDERADLVVTDPPYNVNVVGSGEQNLTIKNDNMEDSAFYDFLVKAYRNISLALKPGGVFYVWCADSGPDGEFEMALRQAGDLHESSQLVWVKSSLVFSFGKRDYNQRHEVCKYGWKEGARHYFCEDNSLSTLLKDDTPDFDQMKKEEAIDLLKTIYGKDIQSTVWHFDKTKANKVHPTMKPVDLIKRQLWNSSRTGDLVFDPFLGSGTTIIACEETNRTCFGVEFDPHYCDVIRKRYAEHVYGEGCDWVALTPEESEEA